MSAIPPSLPAPTSSQPATAARRISREFSPAHLQAAAYLYGLPTPSPGQAKVLLLGCGAGANLLPFAINHPQAQAIGIDMDPEAIAHGQSVAQQIGIDNLQLFALDIASLLEQPDLGQFDYILVSGVFALADKSIRRQILTFCEHNLAPDGIICFEYNTYPGGKTSEIVRDALMLHSSLAGDDGQQQMDSARAMLTFLHQGLAPANPLAQALRELTGQAESYGDVELSLTYLQGLNEPCYFVEFNDLLTEAGLCYVGDARPHLEVPAAWGAEVDTLCQTINPARNKVLGQQYLDFLCHRACRHSILAKQSRAASVLPEPDLDRLKDLRWAGYFKRVGLSDGSHGHIQGNGETIRVSNDHSQGILDALGYAWPISLDAQALRLNIESPLDQLKSTSTDSHAQLLSSLKALFLKLGDQLKYTRQAGPYDEARSRHLQRVAGAGAAIHEQEAAAVHRVPMFNLWHEETREPLDSVDSLVLQGLDGHTSINTLIQSLPALENNNNNNTADIPTEPDKDNAAPETPDTATDNTALASLGKLQRLGLLTGSNTAWVTYWTLHLSSTELKLDDIHALCTLLMRALPMDRGGLNRLKPRPTPPVSPKLLDAIKKIQKLQEQNQIIAALKLSKTLTRDYATHPSVWVERYRTLWLAGKHRSLLKPALRAIALQYDDVSLYYNVLVAYSSLALRWPSLHLNLRLLRGNPNLGNAWNQLGTSLKIRDLLTDAELCYRQALQCNSAQSAEIHSNLGSILSMQGKFREARIFFEKTITHPSRFDASMYSNYLFACLHDDSLSTQQLFQLHKQFDQRVKSKLPGKISPSFANRNRDPDRPLRIGFVSSDLRGHAIAHFIEPYWKHLDKSRFQIYAYSNSTIDDAISKKLRTYVHAWHKVSDLSDPQLVKLIASEDIDILFDLSGHTGGNRLPAFAYKPAPIQISWLGTPGTSGLHAIDYTPMNAHYEQLKLDPLDNQFTEKIVYLDIIYPFQPNPTLPDVVELPSLKGNAPFILGSLNRPQKLSGTVLQTWAAILHKLPNSRLLLGAMQADPDNPLTQSLREKMQGYGITEDRLLFRPRADMVSYLEMHGEIDLLLDTFPYTGGTTTFHAAFMGVPTLTLAGQPRASRVGAVLMKQWGLDKFVAYNTQEYINLAVYWSQHREELNHIRQTLGQRMRSSVSTDGIQAARMLEQALRYMWQRWCAGLPPETTRLTRSDSPESLVQTHRLPVSV